MDWMKEQYVYKPVVPKLKTHKTKSELAGLK